MLRFFKSLYLNTRFYYGIGLFTLLFFFSNFWNGIYSITWYLCIVFGLLLIIDLMQLYIGGAKIHAQRILKKQLSNGDENPIYIQLKNLSQLKLFVNIIDEIPVVFQKRDFLMNTILNAGESTQLNYSLFPVKRGEYHFGKLNVYTSTTLGFFARRYNFDNEQSCKVYPSYLQMQRYDFLAFQQRITGFGFKKIRRIGHTMEFEQIKEYVLGDDIRTINWKSTAKQRKLMVNQYQDEREQPIYCLIDTSRNMKMAFNGMRLLDYAINTCLAFSNVAIRKKDKAGLVLFADKVQKIAPASSKPGQLSLLNELLYQVETGFPDAGFDHLYAQIQRNLNQRSVLFLFTNFEHRNALNRQLPYLKAIAKKHLLVVIFFENTELHRLEERRADKLGEVYEKALAQKYALEKVEITQVLRQYGIYSILSTPEQLSINTINKYLELKAKALA